MFAVIIEDGYPCTTRPPLLRLPNVEEGDDSENSTIDFPVKVNSTPVKYLSKDEEEVLYHYGDSCEPIPVYSVDETPLDGPSTLTNALSCPVQYISKVPPSLVTDNYCFICDGDEVSVEDILTECQWWKQTSSSTRFYSSDNMTTFHQVTLLTCRGETRGAYRARLRGGGIAKVSLHKVFRVSRVFSSWRTCPGFHRIVSTINPITEGGEIAYKFKKRIFIQYFWRAEKPHDRALVTKEYLDFRSSSSASPRNSLIPPSSSTTSRSNYPWVSSWSAHGSRDSLGNISPNAVAVARSRASLKFQAVARSLKFATSLRRRQSASVVTTTTVTTTTPPSLNKPEQ
ncbi:hypothetical protein Q1695_013556 [Nippostrongylus brasiliensis]|nr:hypothetical protein Q1695_013556 [Nippostrongylus brasiliensis]